MGLKSVTQITLCPVFVLELIVMLYFFTLRAARGQLPCRVGRDVLHHKKKARE